MSNKIQVTLYNNDELTFSIEDITVNRSSSFNLISKVILTLDDDESYIVISPSNQSIILFSNNLYSKYSKRMMQLAVKNITANGTIYHALSSLADLESFVKSFNLRETVQQEFLKSNDLLPSYVELTKSTEIMTLSFLSQLENLGFSISDFTTKQRDKLSIALVDFIKETGNVLTQKAIFQRFINTLKK